MSVMTLNQYQTKAMDFAKYEGADYPLLALCEEVGEVQGKLAKYIRKHGLSAKDVIDDAYGGEHPELKADLKKELGDVLWQLQAFAFELGLTLEEIAQTNLDKLSGRSERGTIVGEGDER